MTYLPLMRPIYGDRRLASVRDVRSSEQAHGTAIFNAGREQVLSVEIERRAGRRKRRGVEGRGYKSSFGMEDVEVTRTGRGPQDRGDMGRDWCWEGHIGNA